MFDKKNKNKYHDEELLFSGTGYDALIISLFFVVSIFLPQRLNAQNIYFGDLHVHSELSFDCTVPIDLRYSQARYLSELDFVFVSEHDHEITESKWQLSKKKANHYNVQDTFVTFIGYEYTHWLGHKLVFYPGNDGKMFHYLKVKQDQLLDSVRIQGGQIIIPHPDAKWGPSELTQYDPVIVNNIEITGYSGWRHEYFGNQDAPTNQALGKSVQNWLESNWMNKPRLLGFVGVSDAHDDHIPGSKGLTAVFSDSLTRRSIFNSLKRRNTYATTNGQKIILRFNSGKNIMGDSIYHKLLMPKQFEINCTGTAIIERIEIIKNGKLWRTFLPNSIDCFFQFEDRDSIYFTYYYLRITQTDGNMAWSSPIYFFQEPSNISIIEKSVDNSYKLFQNYPNPFNSTTSIGFNLSTDSFIKLKVYNILGQEIKTLIDNFYFAGNYKVTYEAKELNSGIYFYEILITNKNTSYLERKKMIFIK